MLFILMIASCQGSAELPIQNPYIQLSKKRCLGTCPVYDLFIYANGTVVYNGIEHVNRKGKYQFVISEEKLDEIKKLFEDIDLDSLKKKPNRRIRDLPVTNLIVDNQKLSFQGQNIPEEIKNIIVALEALI